ncbi:amino acid ABC transporter ATP-binding protein [Ensifer sp. LC163]|uniref:amino acid ABC transporter ATP-binding protein n=1 Tax=Ensifer sp. LC163 TaxID=1120652 RepID=UPI000813A9F6|nr:amino acid ABC transporter ATP-binding protein [Ensifer sp. LC163]OCP35977.1 ectoine/hydroxyectoine ABC transporter ATP-binding protein EhuA [Ensifer sp. LC163]
MNPLLSVTGLTKSYGAVEVLKGIDFDVAAGEKIALIGPSGSGKSTCLRCLNFLEKPSAGAIHLDGERIGVRLGRPMSDRQLAPQRAEMGMVFQLFNLWPHLSVTENVAIAARKVRGLPAKEAQELALDMLAKVHMTHRADASPLELSGGQQQRVAIARALAQKPKLMLFDELTSALDPELVHEVLKVMEELAAEGRTMLIVTHEIAFARDIADRVLFLDGGRIVEQGPARALILSPREPRTQAFLRQIRH